MRDWGGCVDGLSRMHLAGTTREAALLWRPRAEGMRGDYEGSDGDEDSGCVGLQRAWRGESSEQ
jgi:hypothetical protein